MTKRDSFIKKDLFMNILMWLEDWDGRVPMPAVLKPEPLWTGKQVVNLIIPRVNVRRKAAWSKDHEDQDMTPYDSQVPLSLSFCLCWQGKSSSLVALAQHYPCTCMLVQGIYSLLSLHCFLDARDLFHV